MHLEKAAWLQWIVIGFKSPKAKAVMPLPHLDQPGLLTPCWERNVTHSSPQIYNLVPMQIRHPDQDQSEDQTGSPLRSALWGIKTIAEWVRPSFLTCAQVSPHFPSLKTYFHYKFIYRKTPTILMLCYSETDWGNCDRIKITATQEYQLWHELTYGNPLRKHSGDKGSEVAHYKFLVILTSGPL